MFVVAVADDFGGCRGVAQEGLDGSFVVDDRQMALKGLLHGADGDFLEAAAVDVSALGVVGYEWCYLVDANFDGFLDKPLNAVGVLGGGDGKMEVVVGAVGL